MFLAARNLQPFLQPTFTVLKSSANPVAQEIREGLWLPFFFFCFLGPHLQHMEVPRLGVESELQLLAFTTTQDPSGTATYTTAHGNAGSLTHWVRPRIEPAFSWILVRFITAEPQWELLDPLLNNLGMSNEELKRFQGLNPKTIVNIQTHQYH